MNVTREMAERNVARLTARLIERPDHANGLMRSILNMWLRILEDCKREEEDEQNGSKDLGPRADGEDAAEPRVSTHGPVDHESL